MVKNVYTLKNALLVLSLILFASPMSVLAQISITSWSSNSSALGSIITLNGTGFSTNLSENIVKIGSAHAVVVQASATQIKAQIPANGDDARVSVTNTSTHLTAVAPRHFYNRFCGTQNMAGTSSITIAPEANRVAMVGNDVDGDGRHDIVGGNSFTATISVQRGNQGTSPNFLGAFSFPAGSTVTGAYFNMLVMADLDADGLDDVIATSGTTNDFWVMKNTSTPGNVAFASAVPFTMSGTGRNIAAEDFDGDGKIDLAITSASPTNSIYIFRNTSSGSSIAFTYNQTLSLPAAPLHLGVGDVNNNGTADLIPSFNDLNGIAFVNNSISGSFSFANTAFTYAANKRQVEVVDMDADGYLDLASISTGTLVFYRNLGVANSIGYAAAVTNSVGGAPNPTKLTLIDMNGDSKPEPMFTMSFGWTCVFENQSTTGSTIACAVMRDRIESSTTFNDMIHGDFNGDGMMEVGSVIFDGSLKIVGSDPGGAPYLGLNIQVQTACPSTGGSATVAQVYGSTNSNPVFSWSSGATGPTANSLSPGINSVTTTISGCTLNIEFYVGTGDPAFAIGSAQTPASCLGGNDGTATAQINGGTGPFTYLWSNSGTTQTISGLPAGIYAVTVTNGTGCELSTNVVVADGTPINVNGGNDQVICTGESVTLTATGADNYSWTGGAQNGTPFTPTAPGNFIVTGTTLSGCTGFDTVNIMLNPLPNTSFSASINAGTVQFFDATPGQTTAWSWTFGDGNTSSAQNPSHTYASPGTYSVCLTSTNQFGCTQQRCENITVTTTAVNNGFEGAISVAPVPAKDVLYLNLENGWNQATCTVLDQMGKVVRVLNAAAGINEIQVGDLSAGIYFLEVGSGDQLQRGKFVIAR